MIDRSQNAAAHLLISELPLTGDAGGISSVFKDMRKGLFFPVQHPELHIVTDIVSAGHDLSSARRAERLGKAIGEANASGR